MTARSFISSHRNCRRFLAATHHAAIINNYAHDLQVLHFTLERGLPIGFRRGANGESTRKVKRKGITFLHAVKMFDDEEKSRKRLEEQQKPNGPFCPHCGSFNVQSSIRA